MRVLPMGFWKNFDNFRPLICHDPTYISWATAILSLPRVGHLQFISSSLFHSHLSYMGKWGV